MLLETDYTQQKPEHASFAPRLAALLLDFAILGIPLIALNFYNIIELRSAVLHVLIFIIGLSYKPFTEYKYHGTPGKLIMKLEVVDNNYDYIDLQKSFLRSLILLIPRFLSLITYVLAFSNPESVNVEGYFAFATWVASEYKILTIISSIISYLSIADIIVYLVNINGNQRSLKDVIADTYVVEKIKDH
ncbi:MAG: RDD family protein [Nonlabens sp.]